MSEDDKERFLNRGRLNDEEQENKGQEIDAVFQKMIAESKYRHN